jgi:hypothetical protein
MRPTPDTNEGHGSQLLAHKTRILQYYDEHPGLGIWMTVERGTGTASAFTF